MRFLIALLAFALITLVLSSPLPDEQGSNDKVSDKNVESSSKSSSSSSSSGTGDKSKTSSQNQSDSKAADSKAADSKAADSKAADSNGGATVLSSQPYSALQISDGKAGNAEEEASAKFKGLDKGDLSKVSNEDLKFINAITQVAQKVEVENFNPAIEKASGQEAKILQNGKIKNKVLKTTAAVLALEIKMAKGKFNNLDVLAEEKAKKAKNIGLDVAAKGEDSKGMIVDDSIGI